MIAEFQTGDPVSLTATSSFRPLQKVEIKERRGGNQLTHTYDTLFSVFSSRLLGGNSRIFCCFMSHAEVGADGSIAFGMLLYASLFSVSGKIHSQLGKIRNRGHKLMCARLGVTSPHGAPGKGTKRDPASACHREDTMFESGEMKPGAESLVVNHPHRDDPKGKTLPIKAT